MDQKDIKINNLKSLLSEAIADNELDKLVDETQSEAPVSDDNCVEKCAADVMSAYQNANKWLDTVKEVVYTKLSCPFFSSFVHELAHTMPGRFDKFGDILHTVNMEIPYPATTELANKPTDIGGAFSVIYMVLDDIKDKLNKFIECTDKDFHGMSCAAEALLNDIEGEYPMMNRLKDTWDKCEGDTVEFDKYTAQYVEHKDKLLEETSVDEVEGTKLPDGTSDKEPEEGAPEVTTDTVIDTVDSAEDVKGESESDLQEETSVDEPDGTKLPEGTTDKDPEEGAPEVTTDTVIDTVDSSEDVEGKSESDLQEETSVDEPDGVKLPEGVLEKKPEEDAPEVTNDTVLDTVDSSEDVEGESESDLQEETSVDEVEGTKLPEGVLEKKPEEDAPEVTNDTVLDTVDSSEDVEGESESDLQEETSVDEPDGVKLPEGVLEKKPEEDAPEVTTDTVIDTVDSSEDVEGKSESDLQEAINRLNLFIDSLNEETSVDEPDGTKLPDGTADKDPEEDAPEVTTDTVINTVDSSEDVEGKKNEDAPAEKAPESGKCENENTPGNLTGVKTVDGTSLKKYNSLKEAVKLGREYFDTTEKIELLKEQVAVLLAKENEDLLYEEYAKSLTKAKALREQIEKKYSIISNNRVDNLLESMEIASQKFAAKKADMFKKLNEQIEINKALSDAKEVSVDEAAFGEMNEADHSARIKQIDDIIGELGDRVSAEGASSNTEDRIRELEAEKAELEKADKEDSDKND